MFQRPLLGDHRVMVHRKQRQPLKKHLPFLSVLLYQYCGFLILVGVSLSFYMAYMAHPHFGLAVAAIIILFNAAADVVLMILSLTVWWNVPFTIREDGLFWKSQIFRWEDAASISVKIILRLAPRMTFYLMNVVYSDGRSIRIDLNGPIAKDINKICRDQRFLEMLEKAKKLDSDR